MSEKHIPIKEIQPPPTFLDWPSALLSNEVALFLAVKSVFQRIL